MNGTNLVLFLAAKTTGLTCSWAGSVSVSLVSVDFYSYLCSDLHAFQQQRGKSLHLWQYMNDRLDIHLAYNYIVSDTAVRATSLRNHSGRLASSAWMVVGMMSLPSASSMAAAAPT